MHKFASTTQHKAHTTKNTFDSIDSSRARQDLNTFYTNERIVERVIENGVRPYFDNLIKHQKNLRDIDSLEERKVIEEAWKQAEKIDHFTTGAMIHKMDAYERQY